MPGRFRPDNILQGKGPVIAVNPAPAPSFKLNLSFALLLYRNFRKYELLASVILGSCSQTFRVENLPPWAHMAIDTFSYSLVIWGVRVGEEGNRGFTNCDHAGACQVFTESNYSGNRHTIYLSRHCLEDPQRKSAGKPARYRHKALSGLIPLILVQQTRYQCPSQRIHDEFFIRISGDQLFISIHKLQHILFRPMDYYLIT